MERGARARRTWCCGSRSGIRLLLCKEGREEEETPKLSSPSESIKTRWWPMVTRLPGGVQPQLQACAGEEPRAALLLVEAVPAQCSSSTPMRLLGARCPLTLF